MLRVQTILTWNSGNKNSPGEGLILRFLREKVSPLLSILQITARLNVRFLN